MPVLLLACFFGCHGSAKKPEVVSGGQDPSDAAADVPGDGGVATSQGDAAPQATGGTASGGPPNSTGTEPKPPLGGAIPGESEDHFSRVKSLGSACSVALHGRRIADADRLVAYAETKDPFALVSRAPQGTLANDDAPADLVRLYDLKPSTGQQCMAIPCLQKDAADGLRVLLTEMQKRGFPGMVESSFRSYPIQCGTFTRWATQGSFCSAVEQSALPGHSQHQLGTAVDLFTRAWHAADQNVFRNGFGCTPGGNFLRDDAWQYGWVLSYPIHLDDRSKARACEVRSDRMVSINPRTGYKNEAWHIRYLGVEDATAFHQAFAATAGTVDEVTLEQWLRKKHGLVAPETELPVCDGCRCGACSTLAAPGSKDAVCTGGALFLDEQGRVQKAPTGAHLGEITVVRKGDVLELTIAATLDPLVVTRPPLATSGHSVQYSSGEDYMHARPLADLLPRPYRERPGAIRVGVGIAGDTTFPYRAALTTNTVAEVWGRENVLLPTFLGPVTVRMEIPAPPRPTKLTVALVHDGTHYDARDISY